MNVVGFPYQRTTQQRIVLRVDMKNPKCRSRALQIVVGQQGVMSASLAGEDMNQIVVMGNGIDSVILTKKLRKKIGHTEIVSISSEEEPPAGGHGQTPSFWAVQPSAPPMYVHHQQLHDPATPNCCMLS